MARPGATSLTALPAHSAPGGIVVTVRAAPKARREGIEGIEARPRGAALKIAIATAPTEGRANKRLAEILANALDVAPSAVTIRTGAASRDKTVFVAGDAGHLLQTLGRLALRPEAS